jgi:hypothetical protein
MHSEVTHKQISYWNIHKNISKIKKTLKQAVNETWDVDRIKIAISEALRPEGEIEETAWMDEIFESQSMLEGLNLDIPNFVESEGGEEESEDGS